MVRALSLADNGAIAVAGYENGTVAVWNTNAGNLLARRAAHKSQVNGARIVQDLVVTGGDDGFLRVWELPGLQLRREIRASDFPINAVAVTSDGRSAITATVRMNGKCRVGVVQVWSIDDGICLRELSEWGNVPLHTCGGWWWVHEMLLMPNNGALITTVDEEVQIWDVQSGELQQRWSWGELRNRVGIGAIAVSPDGRTLAAGSWYQSIRLWDLARGEPRHEFRVPRDGITSLAWSPDGRHLAVATGYDPRVWIFDVATGQRVRSLRRHTNSVRCIAYGSQSSRIVTAGADGSVKVWRFLDLEHDLRLDQC